MALTELWVELHRATCLPRRQVLAFLTRRELTSAMRSGRLVSPAPGFFAIPGVRPGQALAIARRAVLSRQARGVAAWAGPRSGSLMETLVRATMIQGQIRGWVEQHLIEAGGVRHWTDFAFPARRVVVEAEGYAFHAGVREFTNDCARYNRLVAAGWTVVRVTWRDLADPHRLCTLLRRVLGRRRGRGEVVVA